MASGHDSEGPTASSGGGSAGEAPTKHAASPSHVEQSRTFTIPYADLKRHEEEYRKQRQEEEEEEEYRRQQAEEEEEERWRTAAETDDPGEASDEPTDPGKKPAGGADKTSPDRPDAEKPYIAPIPKITPVSSDSSPAELAAGLEGRYVDEFGNVLDWDGTVLGRVEGDLPSMVGREVTASGEILDAEGEVAGHVAENYVKPPLQALGDGFKVDHEGNIYSQDGQVVGKLNKPPGSGSGSGGGSGGASIPKGHHQMAFGSKAGQQKPGPAPTRTATPSPSEIYLDVKSTHDGIQLIIKIPTVFNRENEDNNKKGKP